MPVLAWSVNTWAQPGFFEKALHRAVLGGEHEAVFQAVLLPVEEKGGLRLAAAGGTQWPRSDQSRRHSRR